MCASYYQNLGHIIHVICCSMYGIFNVSTECVIATITEYVYNATWGIWQKCCLLLLGSGEKEWNKHWKWIGICHIDGTGAGKIGFFLDNQVKIKGICKKIKEDTGTT